MSLICIFFHSALTLLLLLIVIALGTPELLSLLIVIALAIWGGRGLGVIQGFSDEKNTLEGVSDHPPKEGGGCTTNPLNSDLRRTKGQEFSQLFYTWY
jgi:hypothetical protein